MVSGKWLVASGCRRGFTLIELLVYMAIMSFIIVVAGRVFSDSTSMRIRSQNMLASAEQLGNLSALLNEDLSQMGAKAWMESSLDRDFVLIDNSVYMNPNSIDNPDFSSYKLWHRTYGDIEERRNDSIVFRVMVMDEDGIYTGVKEVSWALSEDGKIHRRCRTVSAAIADAIVDDCPNAQSLDDENVIPVLMGSGINEFYLMPSVPGITPGTASESLLFPSSGSSFSLVSREVTGKVKSISTNANANYVTVFGFANNQDNTAADFNQLLLSHNGNTECTELTLAGGEVYAVEFQMHIPYSSEEIDSISTQLQPGIDHIAVGLRNKETLMPIPNGPVDVQLYPPQSGSADNLVRYAEFSIPNSEVPTNVCVALTFAFYSPLAYGGKLNFQNFKVYRVDSKAFHFPREEWGYGAFYGTEDSQAAELMQHKKDVKAFEMIMEVERKGEKIRTAFTEGSGIVILTPNNGIQARGSTL